ncbi:MAG: ArgE/DapE family deacylase [Gemmatimonadaceae bacterium]|nr:ArgE/DapE family deacylase [Gemmatimonadaceae bacterium]
MEIARGDAVALARALIKIDSRNPTLVPGAPGESGCALFLARVLQEWGFETELLEQVGGRPNLVARIGPRDAPSLMFAGHLDVVGVEGMIHPPFSAEIRDSRIYGRGSADMKGGIAAMCAAAAIAIDGTSRKNVVIAAVVDEEYESLGMRALLESGVRAEAAVLTEPTRLAICPAHRGFVWMNVAIRGRAAHGSRYDLGVDAITHAGLLLAELHALEQTREGALTHRLLGRASLHASTVSGGTGMSTYPDFCELTIERRTLPGETAEGALSEVRDAIDRVKAEDSRFDASVTLNTAQAPSDVSADAPIVRKLASALRAEGLESPIEGLSAWTDAALLNEAGIPAICFGPGDIALAHSAEEWVPISEVESATRVLAKLASDWCG